MVKKRDIISQIVLITILIIIGHYFFSNVSDNLSKRGIASGFGFLNDTAGFDIIMSLIPFSATSTYWRLFIVGILNTILLSGLAIVFATIIGFIIGIARLSTNWLIAKLSAVYIEIFRNIPLLLQIFFWYYLILHHLPQGLYLPIHDIVIIPELMAMLVAISLYSACYIAENVRSGILSVDHGQTEAARALGLKRKQMYLFIVLPQASKVIIPSLTSQYLNITKNSSLSAAIGYPDLVSVFAGTALSQTGQAIETIFMTMLVYLSISLSISVFMNWYNNKILMVGR